MTSTCQEANDILAALVSYFPDEIDLNERPFEDESVFIELSEVAASNLFGHYLKYFLNSEDGVRFSDLAMIHLLSTLAEPNKFSRLQDFLKEHYRARYDIVVKFLQFVRKYEDKHIFKKDASYECYRKALEVWV